MANTKTFHLPDLGEGLPDAEVVSWHVQEGQSVELDQPLVAMETAKAVVDVPSPYTGKLVKCYGESGDIIETGHGLADFELSDGPQRSEAVDTGHHHKPVEAPAAPEPVAAETPAPAAVAASAPEPAETPAPTSASEDDGGTVVGTMETSNKVVAERAVAMFGVKAVPAVRALAKKLGVDLARVPATGADSSVSLVDVKKAAKEGTARIEDSRPPAAAAAVSPVRAVPTPAPATSSAPTGQAEPLRGVRRNMARIMADAHAQVVPTVLFDDADMHAWFPGQDVTLRLIRALVYAAQQEPALNAHFNYASSERTLFDRVDVGLAVDTEEGLFVPALRDCASLDIHALRARIEDIREQIRLRQIPPDELRNYTIMLSNFGKYAGRYATPIIVPPCVAILAAGRLRHQPTSVMGGIESHKVIPLSLCFDHRACTGGEAARFLAALMHDLALPQ